MERLTRIEKFESLDPQVFAAHMASYREYHGFTMAEAAIALQMKTQHVKIIEKDCRFPFVGDELQRVWRAVKIYDPLHEI